MKEENPVRRGTTLLEGEHGEATHRWFPVLEGDSVFVSPLEKGFGGLLNLDTLVVTRLLGWGEFFQKFSFALFFFNLYLSKVSSKVREPKKYNY